MIVVAAVLALLGGLAVLSHQERDAPSPSPRPGSATPTAPAAAPSTENGIPHWAGPRPPDVDPALSIGRDDAPVTIVEFADYQCPYCGEFARTVQPALVAKYVNSGVLQIVWRDFPYYGPPSVDAAVAARAAGQQGRFWAFHDALYAHQLPARSGRLTMTFLEGLARGLGLDMPRFDAAFRDPAIRNAVEADFSFGQQLGVPGTPSFLVNGSPEIFGSQPLATFEHSIDEARGQAKEPTVPR